MLNGAHKEVVLQNGNTATRQNAKTAKQQN
jgi:hypothetical protein